MEELMDPIMLSKNQSYDSEHKEGEPLTPKHSCEEEQHKKLSPKIIESALFGKHSKIRPDPLSHTESLNSPKSHKTTLKKPKKSEKIKPAQKSHHLHNYFHEDYRSESTKQLDNDKHPLPALARTNTTDGNMPAVAVKKYKSGDNKAPPKSKPKLTRIQSLNNLSSPSSFNPDDGQLRLSKPLEMYSEIKQRKAIEKFDKSIIDKIDKHWEICEKPKISAHEVNKEIYFFSRTRIFNLLEFENGFDFFELYQAACLRAPILLRAIQKSGVAISLVSKRLKILYDAVCRWHEFGNVKTPGSTKLQNWLKTAAQVPSLDDSEKIDDIAVFLKLFEELHQYSSEELVRRIYKGFGDTQSEIEETISRLRMWSGEDEESNSQALLQLDTFIRQACADNILAKKITDIQYSLLISNKFVDILKNITPSEVRRCIMPLHQPHILFKKIVINGTTVHDENNYSQNFWKILFTKIYENFEKNSMDSIKKQIAYFELIGESNNPENLKSKIPGFQILRLMSNSCWGVGDLFFRKFFPSLTKSPYWLKVAKGIYCHIKITSSSNYAVTQLKTYTLYPLMNPLDKTSTLVNDKKPLAHMLIAWTTSVKNDKWRGKIKIVDLQILKTGDEKDKWLLYKSLSDLTHIKNTAY